MILLLPVLLLLFTFVALFIYLNRNVHYWKRRNIPYFKPTPCVGHTGSVMLFKKSLGDLIGELHKQTDEPYIGFFTLDQPALLVRDKELIRNIFVRDFNYFMNRCFATDEELEPINGQTLFGMKGEKWRKLRALLTSSFTSGKMKNMFYLVREQTSRLDWLLEQLTDNSKEMFNPKDVYARFTTDVITSCAFGLEPESIENPKAYFREMGRQFFEPTTSEALVTSLMFTAPWVLQMFKLSFKEDKFYDVMRNAVWSIIDHRQKNNVHRNDFLDLLIEIREKTLRDKEINGGNVVLDGDTLIAQAYGFLIAGFETSSFTISMTLYEFALNPDIQEKAREEVRTILEREKQLTYDNLREMKYLKQCMDETLRKYPPLTFLDRICTTNYQIPGTKHVIEKGVRVFIPLQALQNDPNVFTEPEKYMPERFSDDKLNNYKLNYYPFGEGPRMCIGMRFGVMQTMTGLAHFLSKYRVKPCASTPIPIKFDPKTFNLTVHEIPLKLTMCK